MKGVGSTLVPFPVAVVTFCLTVQEYSPSWWVVTAADPEVVETSDPQSRNGQGRVSGPKSLPLSMRAARSSRRGMVGLFPSPTHCSPIRSKAFAFLLPSPACSAPPSFPSLPQRKLVLPRKEDSPAREYKLRLSQLLISHALLVRKQGQVGLERCLSS